MTTKQQTATHTPGPWAPTEGESGWSITADTDPVDIATVAIPGRMSKFGQAEANARLIAAAPDLLESLRDLVEKITAAGWHEAEISEAKVAIAKATRE